MMIFKNLKLIAFYDFTSTEPMP